LRIVPKVGPFAPLAFKAPTPEVERLFIESFNATLDAYRGVLSKARTGRLNLQNRDFDTGEPTRAGEYKLADETYGKLLIKLAGNDFESVTPELRQNILAFYGDLICDCNKAGQREWQKTLSTLDKLKAARTPPGNTVRFLKTAAPFSI
jgi:hypothetical protein